MRANPAPGAWRSTAAVRRLRRGLARGGLAGLVPAALAAADPFVLVLPQTLHQPVGATTALRSGATIATGEEAGATWYNPALAALLPADQVDASATAYGLNQITVTNGQDSDAVLSGAVLKAFGAWAGRNGSLGWTVMFANPMHWTGAIDSGKSNPEPGSRSYASHARTSQDTWAGQAAAAWQPRPGVELGVGLTGLYDSVDLNQSLWARDVNGRSAASSTVTSAWAASLQGTCGASWQVHDRLSMGLSLRTQAYTLDSAGMSSATASAQDPASGDGITSDMRNDDAPYRFVHPLQIGLGGAWHEPTWMAEVDLVWSLPPPSHDTLDALHGQQVATSGGVTTITDISQPARYTRYRNVVNLRAGTAIDLSDSLTLHAGAFTDRSPVADSDIYSRIDLTGVSAGLAIRRGANKSGIVIGVSASWGDEAISIYDPSTDRNTPGHLRVLSVDALIGTVARF